MLLDDIIALATDNQQPLSVLLRKCLILAHELHNDLLKDWVKSELDGIPPKRNYRTIESCPRSGRLEYSPDRRGCRSKRAYRRTC